MKAVSRIADHLLASSRPHSLGENALTPILQTESSDKASFPSGDFLREKVERHYQPFKQGGENTTVPAISFEESQAASSLYKCTRQNEDFRGIEKATSGRHNEFVSGRYHCQRQLDSRDSYGTVLGSCDWPFFL